MLHDAPVAVFGWTVLALVFVDELLAMAAFGIWGWQHDPRWLLDRANVAVACAGCNRKRGHWAKQPDPFAIQESIS